MACYDNNSCKERQPAKHLFSIGPLVSCTFLHFLCLKLQTWQVQLDHNCQNFKLANLADCISCAFALNKLVY